VIVQASRSYAFDNASKYAHAHHEALAALYDPFTLWRISRLLDLPGARCLDVAAGFGSVATWLASQVGEHGYVLATDLDPRHISQVEHLAVMEHDITTGSPLGTDYDLVHVRLLLNHLPQRRHILHRLITMLTTGGILLTQDALPTSPEEYVILAPTPEDAALIARFQDTHLKVLAKHGNDRIWATQAHLALLEEGLVDVETVTYSATWRGGGPGCQFVAAGLAQLRPELIAAGMTSADLDHVRNLFDNPGLLLRGHLLHSTSGHQPVAAEAESDHG
jgi:SAM-dependent methyltransferase